MFQLVCKISPTFSHLSELRDFFRDWQHWLFLWRTYQMPSSSQEETAMPCYLVLLAICLMNWLFGDQGVHILALLSHGLAFCTKELAYLLFCLMDWPFGGQVSCHTLLLSAEVRQWSSVVWPQVNWSRVVDENCTNPCFISGSWVQHIFSSLN